MPTAEETAAAEQSAAAEKAASEKAAADQAAADKVAADKAAADKAAADAAAAAGKTPEQLAADKATVDAEPARTDGTPPKAPEKYALTLPETSLYSPADLEMLSTLARGLDLDQPTAQTFVEAMSDHVSALAAANLAAAKADPEIGGDKFTETTRLAQAGRDALLDGATPEEIEEVSRFFDSTALGNHKTFLRLMARIGRQRADDTPPRASHASASDRKSDEEVFFAASTSKPA